MMLKITPTRDNPPESSIHHRFKLLSLLALLCVSSQSLAGPLCAMQPTPFDSTVDRPADPQSINQMGFAYRVLCPGKSCGGLDFKQNSGIPNAMAYWDRRSVPRIRYNVNFITQKSSRYGLQATYGIFAHELGHIIDLKQRPNPDIRQWDREAQADKISGCALARSGLPINAFDSSLRLAPGTENYPAGAERIQFVYQGYQRCLVTAPQAFLHNLGQ